MNKDSTMDSDGLLDRNAVGDGLHGPTGEPLHDGVSGPHVLFDDGSFSWVRAWIDSSGNEWLLRESDSGMLYYIGTDGTVIPDDTVAFEGSGTPTESLVEYWAETAVAEGWTRHEWEDLASEWPAWESDIARYVESPSAPASLADTVLPASD